MSNSTNHGTIAFEAPPKVRPLVLWVMRLAALVAASVSAYSVTTALRSTEAVGCSGSLDCDEVLNSSWSTWFGLPVAIPAMSLYLTLFCALGFAGPLTPPNVRGIAWRLSRVLSLMAGAAALWFFGLQLFVLGKFCLWCLTVHMSGLGLAVLALLAVPSSWRPLRASLAAALCGFAMLVAGQFVGAKAEPKKLERIVAARPKLTREDQLQTVTTQRLTLDDLYSADDLTLPAEARPASQAHAPETTGEAEAPPPPSLDDLLVPSNDPPSETLPHEASPSETPARPAETRSRIVSLFRGDAQLDVYQHPVLGSPAAPHVIVKLYDYTCPHCRQMHEHLEQAHKEFGGNLAVVMCPVPLNKQCNPHVTYDSSKHADACDLARLALAVWQADPAKFEEFDAWLFASSPPPTAAAARERAVELVSEKQLVAELYSPRLRERLAAGPKLYKLFGAGTVPKLVLPTGLLVGPGESTAAVMLELKKEFAQPPVNSLR